jgi:hypothetical protein
MQRSRFRVITKGVEKHTIVDRSTGQTVGFYADDQKAWIKTRQLNSGADDYSGKLEKLSPHER